MSSYLPTRARREEAQERLVAELAKDFEARPEFDPWSLFPSVYGSYSQEFDECAIAVLSEIRDREKRRRDLGAEMFREMLCTAGLCDYGTSPRVCFWGVDDHLLPQLIDKWTEWSRREWGENPMEDE